MNENQGVGAALKIGQRLRRRLPGIRVIDALRQPPRPGRPNRLRHRRGRLVEWLDAEAVGGLRNEAFLEIGPFQRGLDGAAPALAGRGLEQLGERTIFHLGRDLDVLSVFSPLLERAATWPQSLARGAGGRQPTLVRVAAPASFKILKVQPKIISPAKPSEPTMMRHQANSQKPWRET
jgi:hypothetical protein